MGSAACHPLTPYPPKSTYSPFRLRQRGIFRTLINLAKFSVHPYQGSALPLSFESGFVDLALRPVVERSRIAPLVEAAYVRRMIKFPAS